jgi:hypothetical protein
MESHKFHVPNHQPGASSEIAGLQMGTFTSEKLELSHEFTNNIVGLDMRDII